MPDNGLTFHEFLAQSAWLWLTFAVSFLLLIWLVVRIGAWLREDTGPAASDYEMLTAIGEMHRRGDLSDEEFRSIKSQLVERIGEGPPSQRAAGVNGGETADSGDASSP